MVGGLGYPSGDTMARAFIQAATHTGERPWLAAGRLPLRGRWLVFYALQCAGLDWASAQRLCAIPPAVEAANMVRVFLTTWWNWHVAAELTTLIAEGLA